MQQTSLTVICTAAIFSWPGDYYLSVQAVTWRIPVINYSRAFSPALTGLLAPWRIIRVDHLSLGDQPLVGVIKPWPTPSHLPWLPKRQELPMGHLSLCKASPCPLRDSHPCLVWFCFSGPPCECRVEEGETVPLPHTGGMAELCPGLQQQTPDPIVSRASGK